MEADHKRLADIFRRFASKDCEPGRKKELFSEFSTGLRLHIRWEEEILFGLLEKKNKLHMGMGSGNIIAMLRMEHTQIREFLGTIQDDLDAGNTSGEVEIWLEEMLRSHNEKEEEFAYPWLDSSLTAAEKEEALAAMRNLSS